MTNHYNRVNAILDELLGPIPVKPPNIDPTLVFDFSLTVQDIQLLAAMRISVEVCDGN